MGTAPNGMRFPRDPPTKTDFDFMKLSLLVSAGAIALSALAAPAFANSDADLAAFPKPEAGQKQHVIQLPEAEDEWAIKVELIVGKTEMIDCNNHFYGGGLEERIAEGWGYNYYVLPELGAGASTLMGCPDNTKREAFVRSNVETIVRYNSKLPLVVYTPDDVELRYRLWRADAEVVVE
jgi:ecotin